MDKINILTLDNTTALVSPWKADLRRYFNLVEAVGGFEALSKLKQAEYALVIINISLRSFDGSDAVIRIRQKHPQLPIVVLADKADVRFVKNVAVHGIHGYLFLPVNTTQLLSMVSKLTHSDIAEIADTLMQEEREIQKKKEEKNQSEDLEDIPALYYEGQSHLARGEIQQAMDIFNKVINTKRFKDTWRRYIEDSLFQLGRCYIKTNDHNKAIEIFNQFIQKAPTSDFNKAAHFLTAECYEQLNETARAIAIYKKLVNMPPFDSVSTKARKKLKKFQAI
ncbi:MAG: tetratricopeptide repeat protein [Spirochaetes bacterium]|nr:tetratricopeptide repeat protein [Spirochaetota bacterium]